MSEWLRWCEVWFDTARRRRRPGSPRTGVGIRGLRRRRDIPSTGSGQAPSAGFPGTAGRRGCVQWIGAMCSVFAQCVQFSGQGVHFSAECVHFGGRGVQSGRGEFRGERSETGEEGGLPGWLRWCEVWFDTARRRRRPGSPRTEVGIRGLWRRRDTPSASSGQVFGDDGMTGMCPLGQADVSSFGPDVSTFRPNVSSFGGNVSTLAGHVSSSRPRACLRSGDAIAGRPGRGPGAKGRRDPSVTLGKSERAGAEFAGMAGAGSDVNACNAISACVDCIAGRAGRDGVGSEEPADGGSSRSRGSTCLGRPKRG